MEADLEKANDKKQDPKYIEEKSDKENILNQITQIDNDVYISEEERKTKKPTTKVNPGIRITFRKLMWLIHWN